MKKLIVVKLGGSVITNKDSQKPAAQLKAIKRLGKEIGQIYQQNKYKLIIVHGAGSFGHPLVKKYSLHLGVKSTEQKQALGTVYKQLTELNYLILDSLTKNGTPTINFPPHTVITQKNGKLLTFNYSQIEKALEKDLVPVLFGDMVTDTALGYSVISGDTIVAFLANKLKASKVIFLSDVDGVYTADPRLNPAAKLIPEINNQNFKEVIKGLTPTQRSDVTGEMMGKVISLRQNLKNLPVVLTNGLKSKTLQKALTPAATGTKLLLN